jgi:hypothetical protein
MYRNDRGAPSNTERLGLWSLTLPSWAAQARGARTPYAPGAAPSIRRATLRAAATDGVEPLARNPHSLG